MYDSEAVCCQGNQDFHQHFLRQIRLIPTNGEWTPTQLFAQIHVLTAFTTFLTAFLTTLATLLTAVLILLAMRRNQPRFTRLSTASVAEAAETGIRNACILMRTKSVSTWGLLEYNKWLCPQTLWYDGGTRLTGFISFAGFNRFHFFRLIHLRLAACRHRPVHVDSHTKLDDFLAEESRVLDRILRSHHIS